MLLPPQATRFVLIHWLPRAPITDWCGRRRSSISYFRMLSVVRDTCNIRLLLRRVPKCCQVSKQNHQRNFEKCILGSAIDQNVAKHKQQPPHWTARTSADAAHDEIGRRVARCNRPTRRTTKTSHDETVARRNRRMTKTSHDASHCGTKTSHDANVARRVT